MADLGGGRGALAGGGGGNGFGPVLKGGPAGGGNLLAGRPNILGEGGNENLYPPLPDTKDPVNALHMDIYLKTFCRTSTERTDN